MDIAKVLASIELVSSWVGRILAPPLTKFRFWLGQQCGWLREAVYELLYAGISSDRVNVVYGIHPDDFVDIIAAIGHTALNTDIWLGSHVGETVISSVLSAIAGASLEPVVETARLISNVYRGNRPTWAFNIVFLGNVLEYMDEDVLALLMAMGGENVYGTLTYLQQSLGWLYEMEQHGVTREISRAVDDIDSALTWDFDVYRHEARWWFAEGYRTYHKIFTRMLAIVDRIIERAIARLWELRVKLTTVYMWYQHGLVKPDRFAKLIDQVSIEVEMTMDNARKAMDMIEEVIGAVDLEPQLDILEAAVDRVYMLDAELAIKRIQAVGRGGYDQFVNKLIRAIEKFVAMRTRVSNGYSLGFAYPFVSGTYPQPVSSISVEEITALDVASS
jgi:hypothetical protein